MQGRKPLETGYGNEQPHIVQLLQTLGFEVARSNGCDCSDLDRQHEKSLHPVKLYKRRNKIW